MNFGERVVIIGPNGSGKSTLVAALLGDIALTSGTQRLGSSVRLGRLEQARTQLTTARDGSGQTTLAAFQSASGLTVSEARTLLAKFGVGAEHVKEDLARQTSGAAGWQI